MAKTLLNAVNDVMKRAELTAGDAGDIGTLVDSARQNDIDVIIQVVNEGIEELYSVASDSLPNQRAESSITLVESQRAYALQTNYLRLHFPLINQTNTEYILEFDGTYDDVLKLDPERDDTGRPIYGVIRPTDGYLYLYPTPDSVNAGKVFTYQYDQDTSLADAADTVPFNDAVYRAMVPVWFQLWKRERRGEYDLPLVKAHMGRAARLMTKLTLRTDYCPR